MFWNKMKKNAAIFAIIFNLGKMIKPITVIHEQILPDMYVIEHIIYLTFATISTIALCYGYFKNKLWLIKPAYMIGAIR